MGNFYSCASNVNEGVSEVRQNLIPQMSDLTKKMKDYLDNHNVADFVKKKITADRIISVLLSIVNIYRHHEIVDVITNMSILLCQFGIAEHVISPLLSSLMDKLVGLRDAWKGRTVVTRPQGGTETDPDDQQSWKEWFCGFRDVAADKVFHIIGIVMKTISSGKVPSDGFNDVLINWAGEARKWWSVKQGIVAIANIVDWIIRVVKFIFDKICGYEDPNYAALREVEKHSECVSKWVRECLETDCDFIHNALAYDPQVQKKILRLAEEAYKYTEMYCVQGAPPVVVGMIREQSRKMQELRLQVEKSRKSSMGRTEPFAIYLAGESGVGKTFYGECLLQELSKANNRPNSNRIYTRLPHTKHWDSYNGSQGVLFDDLGQERDNEQDVAEWFRAKSTAVFIPPQASLEDKGKPFSSDFMVATSNSMFLRPQTIMTHSALWRRRDVAAWVRVRPDFCRPGTHMLDPCKTRDSFDYLEFCVLEDVVNPVPDPGNTARWISEEEFRLMVIRKERIFANNQKILMEMKERRYITEPQGGPLFKKIDVYKGFDTRLLDILVQRPDAWIIDPKYTEGPGTSYPPNVSADDWEVILMDYEAFRAMDIIYQNQFMKNYFLARQQPPEVKKTSRNVGELVYRFTQALKSWIGSLGPIIWRALKEAGKIGLLLLYGAVHVFVFSMGILGGFLAFSKIVQYFNWGEQKGNEIVTTPEAYPSGDERTKTAQKRIVRSALKPEGSSDLNAASIVTNRVIPNIMRVKREIDGLPYVMMAFGVRDRTFLLPKHFFYDHGKVMRRTNTYQPTILFERGGSWIAVAFDERMLYCHPERDLALYQFPASVAAVKRTDHLFVDEDTLSTRSSFNAQLVSVKENVITQNLYANALDLPCQTVNEHFNSYIRTGWMYKAQTLAGDCGSVLVAFDNAMPKKLVGIHVSGQQDNNLGVSELVTNEILDFMMDKLAKQGAVCVIEGVCKPQCGTTLEDLEELQIVPEGDFTILGKVPKKEAVWQPFKTNIKQSKIHGLVAHPCTGPSVLHPRDARLMEPVSPLLQAISKYGKPMVPFPVDDVVAAKGWLKSVIQRKVKNFRARLLTDAEVINGNPLITYLDAMNMQSSAGYPYVLCEHRMRGAKGKSWMFAGPEGNKTLTNVAAIKRLHEREEFAKMGWRMESMWIDCLKDERRSIDKIEKGKTRAFTIPPVDYTMLARKYFLMFCVAFYEAQLTFPSAVGIDCESFQWTVLYNILRGKSEFGFDGDFSSFDGTMSPEIMKIVIEIINDWYGGTIQESRVREVLGDEMIHTCQLSLNCAYMTHRGNPSGNPLTVIINSMVNMCYMYIVYRIAARVNNRASMMRASEFEKNVAFFVYGDDNIVSVHHDILDFFNFNTVNEVFKLFGYQYTCADKMVHSEPWKDLKKLRFLKRGFRYHDSLPLIMLPVMDWNTIMELTNWIRESDDDIAALMENIQDALHFMYFYGQEKFDNFKWRINRALSQKKLAEVVETFNDFDRDFQQKIGV